MPTPQSAACVLAAALLAPAPPLTAAECTPVIDAHLHFYTPEDFWGPAPMFASGRPSPASVEDHVTGTLREMQRNQVVLGIASASLGWNNPDPERLWHSFAAEHPDEVDLPALAAAVASGRVRVFGEIAPEYQGISPADPRWEPLWTLAEEHGVPVAVHTGGGPPGTALRDRPAFRLEYGNPLLLQDVLVRHPKLKVSMMHAGLALYLRETLAMMHIYPELYVDIGAATWVMPFMKEALADFLRQAVARGYGDRILFGSDQMVWPEAISLAVETIRSADYLTTEQKRAILFDNAVRFYGFDEQTVARLVARACPGVG
ncbi:MAG TPA: amidohydrolase family protein [Thermoanaerobaculia bacterium]|nr:amidohydrolase family protein [Thermoanaerobaculia bacterium]